MAEFTKRFQPHRSLVVRGGDSSSSSGPGRRPPLNAEEVALERFLLTPCEAWFEPT